MHTLILLLPVINVAAASIYFRQDLIAHLDEAAALLRAGADRADVISALDGAHGGIGKGLAAIIGSAIVSLVLSVILSRRLSRAVLRPLESLRAAAERLGAGSPERLRWGRRDELGTLADSLDDMADRVQSTHDDLRRSARVDPLTGLANRLLLQERLSAAVRRHRQRTTLLLLDLDGFKQVNDALGHAVGDELLVGLAQRLSSLLPGETIARLGGDEFALLLDGPAGADDCADVAEAVLACLHDPVLVGGRPLPVLGSLGIAEHLTDATDRGQEGRLAEELLRHADLAMYAAKEAGGSRCAAYTPALDEALSERLGIERDLRAALGGGEEIVAHYQPIVRLPGAESVGVEALVRWQHPRRGLLSPAAFLPVAEATGLVVPLGWHLLRAACAQVSEWRARGEVGAGFYASVNLSAAQLDADDLVEQVGAALDDAQLPAHCLVLEMTETVLMDDAPASLARLRALRALGVRLAIDDFGTGYSSFAYLQRFPIDVLKLDKVFVDPLLRGDPEGLALVRAMTALAAVLGLQTVAEGVEHAEQADRLATTGVDLAQGYLFGRPSPAADLVLRQPVPALF